MCKSSNLIAVSILILALLAHTAAAATDPNIGYPSISENWRTLTTPNFRIHFTDRQEDTARRLASIAETIHARLIESIGWTPEDPTEVVLLDTVDMSNGMASPIPYNREYLFLTAPADGELISHNDWLELVFTHEYAHILHLDQVDGFPETMRNIFGRSADSIMPIFTFPQALAPAWVAEGYAVHHESTTGYGRGNNPIYDAIMREEVNQGTESLTAESYEGYSGSRWPFGQVYLYGGYFFEFMQEKYGESKARQYISNYSRNWVPWRMDSRASRVTGKGGKQLWAEYQQWLKKRFSAQAEQIKSLGQMEAETLVAEPYINSTVSPGPDGSLYYLHYDAISHPRIQQVGADGEVRTVKRLLGVEDIDWHPDQGILLTKLEVCNNTDVYADVYRMNADGSGLQRLTHCERILRAVWGPEGEQIYGVRGGDGSYSLVSIGLDGSVESLSELAMGDILGDVSVAPDGSGITAAIKRESSGWNIEWFDLNMGAWRMLTTNGDLEQSPKISPNGQSVYFISDQGGLVNLRRMDLATGETTTLTNVAGHVLDYAFDEAGQLWIATYTATGERIMRLSAGQTFGQPYNARSAGLSRIDTIPAWDNFQPDTSAEDKAYSSLDTLGPTGWTPLLSFGQYQADLIGFQVSGADVLGFHQWGVAPLLFYHHDVQKPGGLAYYSFYNRLLVFASKTVDLEQWDQSDEEPEVYDEETRVQMLLHYPFNRLDWTFDIAVGSGWEQVDRHWTESNTDHRFEDQITGMILSFDNRKAYIHSNGPADGVRVVLTAESYDLIGDSDHEGSAYIVEAEGYLNLGWNHTLSLDLLYGEGDENIRPFELDNGVDLLSEVGGITSLGRREFALRGYSSSPELTGTHIARGILDWRFPVARVYDGFFIPPFGVGKIWGDLFIESGAAWDTGEDQTYYSSAGIELSAEALIGYDSINLPVTLGYVHGLDNNLGEDQFYIRLGLQF